MPRFTTLYSGSSGNCAVVEDGGKFLLIDMGGSCRSTVTGLEDMGLSLQDLSGILITHEHSDHIKGLQVFLKKHKVPLFSNRNTLLEIDRMGAVPPGTELVAMHERDEVKLDGFTVRNFTTSHDSMGSCGWRIVTSGQKTLAYATDLGCMTAGVYTNLQHAELVALESNYDPHMLRTGPYPSYLKKRIASATGHLSNDDSATTVTSLAREGCTKFALCHLSKENNHPLLVEQAMQQALQQEEIQLGDTGVLRVAKRSIPDDWIVF